MRRDLEPDSRLDIRRLPPRMERTPEPELDRREPYRSGSIRLNPEQASVLSDAGRFRVLAVRDVCHSRYQDAYGTMARDLESMQQSGLIDRVKVVTVKGNAWEVITPTPEGRRHARRIVPADQRVHGGLGHSRDLEHDAGLYRMFRLEEQELAKHGYTVRRVVLDSELKGQVWSQVRDRKSAAQRTIAANEVGLEVVDGAIQFPDLRIEFERPDGEQGRVDLELASPHYGPSVMAAKSRAGMKIYIAGQRTPSRGSQHHLGQEVFEL